MGEGRHVDFVESIALGQRGIVERIRRIAGLVEVPLVVGGGVDDEQTAGLQVAKMHLERSRVHRDETVETIAGRVDTLAAELELEAGNTEERAGGGADLGGEVRKRGD